MPDKAAEELLQATLDAISELIESDPDGKKYPRLWALHSDICQYLDQYLVPSKTVPRGQKRKASKS